VITLFDILQYTGLLVGALIGYAFGHGTAGNLGAVVGVIAGITVGWVVGRLPFTVTLRSLLRSLRSAISPTLRSRLDREYFISHLIIAELVNRGEPVESFRPVVVAQLNSKSPDVQRFGRGNAKRWFPELLGPAAG
jgi:hypothetical protein